MLFRFDPFEELDRMKAGAQTRRFLAMDAVRDENEVTIYFDVPGVKLDDLEVTAENNEVTIEAQRRWFDADKNVLIRERDQGSFRRQIYVGENLDTEKLSAKHENGVLVVTIPVAEKARSRKVEVSSVGEAKELETSS